MSNTDYFAENFHAFRAAREEAVAAPFGPLSPVGMVQLEETPLAVNGAPGSWALSDNRVSLTLHPGEQLTLDGQELNPQDTEVTIDLGAVDVAGIWLAAGDRRIEVALRGERPIVRPRDPRNELLTNHTAVPTFPADPAWVIEGRFKAYDEPEQITVGAVLAGVEHHPTAVGTVTLEISGKPHSLTALATAEPDTVGLHFTDDTSGKTTWQEVRVVTAAVNGTTAIVDFNRAVNQPCAFTDHATCPLPPECNHLDVAIIAGEQIPATRK